MTKTILNVFETRCIQQLI